jgi:hypothetical protein
MRKKEKKSMNQDKKSQKQYSDHKNILQKVSKQDLQAATGGCRSCAKIVSLAHQESNKLINQYERVLAETHSVDTALPLSNKAAQFRELARTAQTHASIARPPCQHCQDHGKELQRIANTR